MSKRVMKLKTKIILLIACMVLCLGFVSCGRDYDNSDKRAESVFRGYFVQIETWGDFDKGKFTIVYAKDTKVKYLIWANTYQGGITPLYNADGSLQVYEGDE